MRNPPPRRARLGRSSTPCRDEGYPHGVFDSAGTPVARLGRPPISKRFQAPVQALEKKPVVTAVLVKSPMVAN
jgi:hypothetical protein